VPFHWVRIGSSPPRERRDQVRDICRRHGGRLCENQIFYDGQGQAHALVELPADEKQYDALLTELDAHDWLGLVHADEQATGTKPPGSGKR
jgi:hypothetical protein